MCVCDTKVKMGLDCLTHINNNYTIDNIRNYIIPTQWNKEIEISTFIFPVFKISSKEEFVEIVSKNVVTFLTQILREDHNHLVGSDVSNKNEDEKVERNSLEGFEEDGESEF